MMSKTKNIIALFLMCALISSPFAAAVSTTPVSHNWKQDEFSKPMWGQSLFKPFNEKPQWLKDAEAREDEPGTVLKETVGLAAIFAGIIVAVKSLPMISAWIKTLAKNASNSC